MGLLSKEESMSEGTKVGNACWLTRSCPKLVPFTVAGEHEAGRKMEAREAMLSEQKAGSLSQGA